MKRVVEICSGAQFLGKIAHKLLSKFSPTKHQLENLHFQHQFIYTSIYTSIYQASIPHPDWKHHRAAEQKNH